MEEEDYSETLQAVSSPTNLRITSDDHASQHHDEGEGKFPLLTCDDHAHQRGMQIVMAEKPLSEIPSVISSPTKDRLTELIHFSRAKLLSTHRY